MTRVHFIGIGGSGLSAIARLLQESGYEVSGSDRAISPFAVDLMDAGVRVFEGHDPQHVEHADWVVRSSAVGDDNPEVVAALKANIPVYKRADFLGRLMEDRTGIAVAGTHGKTTTTAMIAWMLYALGRDPSFIIGGTLKNLNVNARAGRGGAFVIEADEYDRMFLGLRPRLAVVTNLEHDHPDCYPTYAEMVAAFEAFVDLLPAEGSLVGCIEDQGASALLARARRRGLDVVAYYVQAEKTVDAPQWMGARGLRVNERGGTDFTAWTNLGPSTAAGVPVSLQVPGEHNVRNALAALAVAALQGLPLADAARVLGDFCGTGRRFELRGEAAGVTVIDDYAHHPTEIRATLAAARARYPGRRIWAVWQPHTYSRTRTLFAEFTRAFADADRVLVTEVYASREAAQDFSSAELVASMPHAAVQFGGSLARSAEILLENLEAGDVVIVLSAGDGDWIGGRVLEALEGGS